MKTVNEIYLEIGQNIFNLIEEDEWSEAHLYMERFHNTVKFNGNYILNNGLKKFLDVWNINIDTNSIHQLHAITTEGGNNRWNKLEFFLLPTGKFDIKFIWDQELQDEIDRYNRQV